MTLLQQINNAPVIRSRDLISRLIKSNYSEQDTLRLFPAETPELQQGAGIVTCNILSYWPGHCEELPVLTCTGCGWTPREAWKAAYRNSRVGLR